MPIERESSVLLSLNICSASSTDLNKYIIFSKLRYRTERKSIRKGENNSK